jgi:serine/threonine protein kinase
MHAVGIMHRDLKPSNLVMAKDNVIKLADFGQARVFTQIQTEGKPPVSN